MTAVLVLRQVCMGKKMLEDAVPTIDTTIGDLVEAITQIALESGRTEEEGYELAAVTLERILERSKNKIAPELVN